MQLHNSFQNIITI